jgi:predicted metal-dependent hydrolase
VRADELEVVVHKSRRRRRTVEARLVGEQIHVYLPAGLSHRAEREWIEKMRARLARKYLPNREELTKSLERRARQLNERYFGGKAKWSEVRVVPTTKTRYASCNPDSGIIRVSAEIRQFPRWVQDYLLVHEIAHLLEPSHSERFWKLVNRYEKAERARGYLMGWAQRGSRQESE